MANFFYDRQIRRFLYQFARMFSNFEVENGIDDQGNVTLVRVPIRYGDASRQAQTILQENSANNLPCAPLMSFYIDTLKYDRPRMQEPNFVDKRHIHQREWDDASQTYEQAQGNAFDIERPMPVPYRIGLKVDIWTTSTNMKLQLLEQVLTLFNPALEIQSTDNYLDWTSLSVVELEDVNWSSRSVPNNEDAIDIATLKFSLPVWISPPARVTKDGVIHKVIASVFDNDGNFVDAINNDDLLLGTRIKVTPHGYQLLLLGNELRILPASTPGDNQNIETFPAPAASDLSWHAVIDEYGVLNDGITQIRLESVIDGVEDVVGTVAYHPSEPDVLLFTVDGDTLPSNTLNPVDAIIDPLASGPLGGFATGTRYLLTNATGDVDNNPDFAAAWNGLVANENDIIEYNGATWDVVFDSQANTVIQFVINLTTNIQFKYDNGQWLRSYEGIYSGGNWGIVL